jgi:hypothetical protein
MNNKQVAGLSNRNSGKSTRTRKQNSSNKSNKNNNNKEKTKDSIGKGGQVQLSKKQVPVSNGYKTKNKGNPKMKNTSSGCTIQHAEMFGQLVSVTGNNTLTGFVVGALTIQPGLPKNFQFLSGIAQNYTSYVFHDFCVVFKPTVPTNTPGTVLLCAESDPNYSAPNDKQSMSNHEGCTEDSVWNLQKFLPDKKIYNKQKSYLLRYAKQNVAIDQLKFFDCMQLFFAYSGVPVGTALGDIWLCYTIEYITPRFDRAVKQISGIETFGFGNAGVISTINQFGDLIRSASNMIGTFASAGMEIINGAVTGGVPGLFFATAKNIVKLVNIAFGPNVSGGAALDTFMSVVLKNQPNSSEFDKNQGGLVILDEDEESHLYDVSQGNVGNYTAYLDTTVNNPYVNLTQDFVLSNGSRIKQWLVKLPAGAVLAVRPGTAGSGAATLSGFNMTDFDSTIGGVLMGVTAMNDTF